MCCSTVYWATGTTATCGPSSPSQGPFRGLLLDEYREISAISTGTYRPTTLMKEATPTGRHHSTRY
jgi:hypothetical protein